MPPGGVYAENVTTRLSGATLAQWFGVQPADLPSIFPNLPNFPNPTLNFVGAAKQRIRA
jgi:hypothetical protein